MPEAPVREQAPTADFGALSNLLSRAERLAEGCSDGCDLPHLLAALVSLPEGIEALLALGFVEEEIANIWARVSELAGIDPLAPAADVQPRPAFKAPTRSKALRSLPTQTPISERPSRLLAQRCAWPRRRRVRPGCHY